MERQSREAQSEGKIGVCSGIGNGNAQVFLLLSSRSSRTTYSKHVIAPWRSLEYDAVLVRGRLPASFWYLLDLNEFATSYSVSGGRRAC